MNSFRVEPFDFKVVGVVWTLWCAFGHVVCWFFFVTMMTVKIVIHIPWGGLDIEFQAAFTKECSVLGEGAAK